MIQDRTFSVGRVFSRGFSVMGHNKLLVFGSALVLLGVPVTLLGRATLDQRTLWMAKDPLTGLLVNLLATLPPVLVLRAILQACLTRAAIADSEGRHASVGECLGLALRRFLPLICVAVLFALGEIVGFALLLVPGILFAITYAVAVPVTVEERVGIIQAFSRASDLTRGARWKILGLWLMVFLLAWLWQGLGRIVSRAVFGAQGDTASSLPGTLWEVILTTVAGAFVGAMIPALYAELRNWKDGPAPSRLSEIFE